jgi:hypothetical protein
MYIVIDDCSPLPTMDGDLYKIMNVQYNDAFWVVGGWQSEN